MSLKWNCHECYDGRRGYTSQRGETVDQKSLVYAVHINGAILRTRNGHIQFRSYCHTGDRQIMSEKRLEWFRICVVCIWNVPHDWSTILRATYHVPPAGVKRQACHNVWKVKIINIGYNKNYTTCLYRRGSQTFPTHGALLELKFAHGALNKIYDLDF